MTARTQSRYIRWFEEVGIEDIPLVGGKNASLGELVRELASRGIKVPNGFAVTAKAYWDFIASAGLEGKLRGILADLDTGDVANLQQRGCCSPTNSPRSSTASPSVPTISPNWY